MKIKIKREVLANAFGKAIKVISTKNVEPYYKDFLITVKGNDIDIIVLGDDIAMSQHIKAEEGENEDGAFETNARLISECVSKMSGDFVYIKDKENSIIVTDDKHSKFTIATKDSSNYPEIDFEEEENAIAINVNDFRKLYNAVGHAVNEASPRDLLRGIDIKISDGELRFAASDSYIFATMAIKADSSTPFEFICSKKAIGAACDTIENADVRISTGEKKAIFKVGNMEIFARTFAGSLPDFRKLVKDSYKYIITVKANEFLPSLDRATIMSESIGKVITPVRLTLNSDGIAYVSSQSNYGDSMDKISYAAAKADEIPFSICFSASYITSIIKAIGEEEITFEFEEAWRAFLIHGKTRDNLQIATPIRG